MNIVFFNSHTLLASHYETELELMSEHLIKRDNIVQLTCEKELPACDTNPYHMQEACERCVSKRKHGLSLLSDSNIKRLSFFKLTEDDKRIKAEAGKILSAYRERRQRFFGPGKPGPAALIREWFTGPDGKCHPSNAKY